MTIREKFKRPPVHQVSAPSAAAYSSHQSSANLVLPSHLLLQFAFTSAKTPESMRPIPIPDDDAANRAINTFNLISPLDGHKVGVIYIGEGQTTEQEILANVIGSNDYLAFLEGLGKLIRLKGATFNTQGLDREYDTDGEFAWCWR